MLDCLIKNESMKNTIILNDDNFSLLEQKIKYSTPKDQVVDPFPKKRNKIQNKTALDRYSELV